MSVSRILLVSSLLLGFSGSVPLLAAGHSDAAMVALVDMNLVFLKHERYKQRIEGLGKKIQGLQKDLLEKDQAIAKQREQLKIYALGSPDFKRLEEEIAREISDHNVTKQLKQKETREEEARIHYETYEEIVQEVTRLATQSGCSLVLRFDSQEIDQRIPAAVQSGVNRMVIYHGPDMDMTPYVIKAVNKEVAGRPANGGGDPLPGQNKLGPGGKPNVKGPR